MGYEAIPVPLEFAETRFHSVSVGVCLGVSETLGCITYADQHALPAGKANRQALQLV